MVVRKASTPTLAQELDNAERLLTRAVAIADELAWAVRARPGRRSAPSCFPQ
jgi:hypothetical protein